MALGAAILPEAARFLNIFLLNAHLIFYLCMITLESSDFNHWISAELYIGFLIRLELLDGFIFASIQSLGYKASYYPSLFNY